MDIKKIPRSMGLAMLVVSVLALNACGNQGKNGNSMERTGLPGDAFTCSATNSQGERLEGFQNERDGTWYLFVPSTQDISELVIHYTGKASDVSAGELNEKESIVTNAFVETGDELEVTTEDGSTSTVVVMQSELPAVQIHLKDTTLQTIHQDKDEKYKGNTFVLSDPEGTYDLTVEDSVEIKGRGNSSWNLFEKKAYQVKFEENTSVMGMGEAKKWVLLANASDDSMMRTQLIFRVAEKLDMKFVPSFEYVDLWIDGAYCGTYMLGEKAEIGSSRLNLQYPSGALFEHDEAFYEEEEYWLYNSALQRHFTVKEIVEEDPAIIASAMKTFDEAVNEFVTYLYSTPTKEITLETLSSMIDVDSFVKYYLINEYALNREAFATSFFWHQDGPDDTIHLGPIWDYDTCMGNDGAGVTQSYGQEHILFRYLLAIPEFQTRIKELFELYKDEFASMAEDADVIKAEIQESAEMNYLRWNVLGKVNPKNPEVSFCTTFDGAVAEIQRWLEGRMENFVIPDSVTVASKVSDDYSSIELYFEDFEQYSRVRFAIWNRESEQNMVIWKDAELVDGVWTGSVDLTSFGETGVYQMDVYVNEETTARATGRNYVEKAAKSPYQLDVTLSEDFHKMEISLKDIEPCQNVCFAVWSVVNAQDDIQWFMAEKNWKGLWTYSVDMSMFADIGEYCVHAYENIDGEFSMLNATTVVVK